MNALQLFLTKNSVDNIQDELVISERLKDFKAVIQAMTGDQHTQSQQMCMENPNSPKKRRFNTKRFNELIVINCLKEPNLKDPEWLKAAGCADSAALMYKSFLAGEISTIAEKVMALSGCDRDIEEDMEEVKNS